MILHQAILLSWLAAAPAAGTATPSKGNPETRAEIESTAPGRAYASPRALAALGRSVLAKRDLDWPRAVAELRTAIAYDPDSLYLGRALAELYREIGEMGLAGAQYAAMVQRFPFDPELRQGWASFLLEQGRWLGAVEQLQAAVRLDRRRLPALPKLLDRLREAAAESSDATLTDAVIQLESLVTGKPVTNELRSSG